MDSLFATMGAVRDAIEKSPPMCSGTCQIPQDQNTLIYGFKEDGTAKWVDLSKATPEQLDIVSAACQRATFGRNQEDVLDETYRKAGQIATKDFKIGFDPYTSGIIDQVHGQLLEGFNDSEKSIRAELYKLNIYDKGSFFKAHKDTPRGENMFGSLVVVFPTFHVGGALYLRHDNKEEVFDSSKILSPFAASTIAYIAFYGDVEHEVAVVESGHRVTLTYNLYFAESSRSPASVPKLSISTGRDLESALGALINEPLFLKGALLGFGMRYKYPVDDTTSLPRMKSMLKGADALLVRVCDALGLQTSLKAVYSDRNNGMVMMDQVLDPTDDMGQHEESMAFVLERDYGGELIKTPDRSDARRDITEPTWITPLSELTELHATYVAYGNEPSIGYIYGDLALMVHVPDSRGLSRREAMDDD